VRFGALDGAPEGAGGHRPGQVTPEHIGCMQIGFGLDVARHNPSRFGEHRVGQQPAGQKLLRRVHTHRGRSNASHSDSRNGAASCGIELHDCGNRDDREIA
jgi:hypothetical protein